MLESYPLFSELSAAEISTLEIMCQRRSLSPGEILFHENERAATLYLVESGTLQVFRSRSDGEKVVGVIVRGDVLGEMALFDPDTRPIRMASVRALDQVVLVVILGSALEGLTKKHPELYGKIQTIVRQRK